MKPEAIILMVISLVIIVGGFLFFVVMDFKSHKKSKQINEKKIIKLKSQPQKQAKIINSQDKVESIKPTIIDVSATEIKKNQNQTLSSNKIKPIKPKIVDATPTETKKNQEVITTTPKVIKKPKKVIKKVDDVKKTQEKPKSDNKKTVVVEGNITTIFDHKKMTVKIIKTQETQEIIDSPEKET